MTQIDLFSEPVPRKEQAEHLNRVAGRIGHIVREFCCVVGVGGEFHADELRAFVIRASGAAPASPDRILRLLRADGTIDYVVVNRRASLYRVTSLKAGL